MLSQTVSPVFIRTWSNVSLSCNPTLAGFHVDQTVAKFCHRWAYVDPLNKITLGTPTKSNFVPATPWTLLLSGPMLHSRWRSVRISDCDSSNVILSGGPTLKTRWVTEQNDVGPTTKSDVSLGYCAIFCHKQWWPLFNVGYIIIIVLLEMLSCFNVTLYQSCHIF